MIRKITTVIIMNRSEIAVLSMFAGIFGMLFCFPFLWTAKIENLVGAGFPFVAGAILFSAGMVTIGLSENK